MRKGGTFDHRNQESEPFEAPVIDEGYIQAVTAHVERNLGVAKCPVIHEIVSPYVHLDVLVAANFHGSGRTALVTCGMGLRPMRTPPEQKRYARMELAVCLPADWPPLFAGSPTRSDIPNNIATDIPQGLGPGAWIVPGLQFTARMPFQYNTYLAEGHTIPNGDPPDPISDGSRLCCSFIAKPKRLGRSFHHLTMPNGEDVYFWTIVFITREEMKYKLRRGAKALTKKLAEHKIDEVIDLDRASVCRGGLLGFFER